MDADDGKVMLYVSRHNAFLTRSIESVLEGQLKTEFIYSDFLETNLTCLTLVADLSATSSRQSSLFPVT